MIIFVAGPYAGNVAHNVSELRGHCAKISDDGDIPVCPVLFTTQFLDDNNEDDRQMGFFIGAAMMKFCDVIRVFGISPGVKQEIELARQLGKPVEYAYAQEAVDMALD